MIITESEFLEATALPEVRSTAWAHLSIELGHLYADEFGTDSKDLDRYFRLVAPFVRAARENCELMLPKGVTPRISTCFLIDDYFNRAGTPAGVIGDLRAAAERNNLTIDYIAREAACVVADGVRLADLVLSSVVDDPVRGSTGGRRPARENGWLANGERSPNQPVMAAMKAQPMWRPPVENGSPRNYIFMDVELYRDQPDGTRKWSCAFLASVWQLLRLGLIRYQREVAVRAYQIEAGAGIPRDWDDLPAILQINPAAQAFAAHRTTSILQNGFLSVEAGVRTILRQVSISTDVLGQLDKRSSDEGIILPKELTKRINYVFFG